MPNEPAAHSDQSTPANHTDDVAASAGAPRASKTKPTIRHRILRTSGLLAIIYVGVCIGLVVMETRLLFPGAYGKEHLDGSESLRA